MAIAFRPPEISSDAAAPNNPYPSNQGTQSMTTNSAGAGPLLHQLPPIGFTIHGTNNVPPSSGGFLLLSPTNAAMPTQGLWVSTPHSVVGQQQMLGGFPPIYHNNTATVPQLHRVAYPLTTTRTPTTTAPLLTRTPLTPQCELRERCFASTPRCTTCSDIRRGK